MKIIRLVMLSFLVLSMHSFIYAQDNTEKPLGYEDLYSALRKTKEKSVDVYRILLSEAPSFIQTQSDYNREKWVVRIDALFNEYMKFRTLDSMMNDVDFNIISTFYSSLSPKDQEQVFDFYVKNYDKAVTVMDADQLSNYIISYYNSGIIKKCKSGNLDYKKMVERLDGDLNHIYSRNKFGNMTVVQAVNLLADGTYNLYKNNDNAFFDIMNTYFEGMGSENLTSEDYITPIMDLYSHYNGDVPVESQKRVVQWLDKVLQFEVTMEQRCRLLIMLGDCLKNSGNKDKAKQSYNQAFLIGASIEDAYLRADLQNIISNKINAL